METDTVRTVVRDTVEKIVQGSEQLPLPDPIILEEASEDTTVQTDTVYITRVEPILEYRTPITNPYFDGLITSTVRGELLDQQFDYAFKQFQINRLETEQIRTQTTHYQRERFRLNAGFSIGANQTGPTQIAPMVGVERPGKWQILYGFDVTSMSHQLTVMRPLLSR